MPNKQLIELEFSKILNTAVTANFIVTDGKSDLELYQGLSGNSNKTMTDLLKYLKGKTGNAISALSINQKSFNSSTKIRVFNLTITFDNGLVKVVEFSLKDGNSNYDTYITIPGNENATLEEYLNKTVNNSHDGITGVSIASSEKEVSI